MSLLEVFTAKENRKIAQECLQEAIDDGIELIQHPITEDSHLRKRAIQYGLDDLGYCLGWYGTAHSEVQHQLRRKAEKGKDGEDDEMTIMQVLREDLELSNVRLLRQEGLSTRRVLNSLL